MKSKILIIIVGVVLLTGTVLALPLILGFGRTGKNTTVLNHDFSFLNKKQIETKLNHDFPLPDSLMLSTSDRQFELKLSSISASIDNKKMANSLLFRRLNQGIGRYISAFFAPKKFNLEITYDQQKLTGFIDDIASQVDKPFIPSEIVLEPSGPIVKKGQVGQKTNINLLNELILAHLVSYQISESIAVPTDLVGQLPNDTVQLNAIDSSKKLIGKTIVLSASDQKITIDDKTLVSWVGFDSSCRTDKIGGYVDGLVMSLKKDPVNAVFKFENGKVFDFQPSQKGYSLDSSRLKSEICPKLIETADSPQKESLLDLPIVYVDPKVKNSDVNNLGIQDLLGHGFSSFKHSTDIRNFNVEKGSSIVNRVLVAPNETFSFLKSLGDVSLDNGFKQAYVIKKGQTVLDVGGGICQVSTTLFRAMLNAGLDITSRQNHAYRVSYYEEDSKPGFDATVFIPSPDLKFVNDTGHYLLIQSTYDGKNKTLAYDIYGTSDGRQASIENYRQWDAQPPPPDVYIDDPTLPPGKVIQDEHRIPGLKTSFEWKVTKDNQIIHQKTFQSVYVPWAAVYRRGPTL